MEGPPQFTRGISQGHDFTRLTFRVNAELPKGEQVRNIFSLSLSLSLSLDVIHIDEDDDVHEIFFPTYTALHHGKLQLTRWIQSKPCNQNGYNT